MKTFDDLTLSDVMFLTKSSTYQDRFFGEYLETKIRYVKLHKMLVKAEAHKLDFTPDCPLELLMQQKRSMGDYLHAMEVRAEYEGVDLSFCIKSLLRDLEAAESGCCVEAPDHPTY